MLLDTDLPYLEPLLLHLREDETLKQYFTRDSFFMPQASFISAINEAVNKNCPAPRSIWILPQDTISGTKKDGCASIGIHNFFIVIFVQCIRDTFVFKEENGRAVLSGQFMELTHLRKLVKKSVFNFAKKHEASMVHPKRYEKISWNKDQMLYPQEHQFLATSIDYTVQILP